MRNQIEWEKEDYFNSLNNLVHMEGLHQNAYMKAYHNPLQNHNSFTNPVSQCLMVKLTTSIFLTAQGQPCMHE